MKGSSRRAATRLIVVAVLAGLALLLIFGGSAEASRSRHRHHATHRTTRHMTHRRTRTTTHSRTRTSYSSTRRRYHTTSTTAGGGRRTYSNQAPSIEVGPQPPIQAGGTMGVQIDRGRPAPAPGPTGVVANVPLTPDTPPLTPRIWRVHVVATDGAIDPQEIVVEPGQRFSVAFDDRMTGGDKLTFDMPSGPTSFAGSVTGGPMQPNTITAPDRAGRYRYFVGQGNDQVSGWLIVNPTASGSTAPVFGGRDIRIVARDFTFNPPSPIVLPGEHVRVTFYNDGETPHNIVFTFPGSQVTFANALAPGEMRTVTMTIPATDGRFFFYDPVGGNRDRGMNGTLVIYRPTAPRGGPGGAAPYGTAPAGGPGYGVGRGR